jgi:hypothetical protein
MSDKLAIRETTEIELGTLRADTPTALIQGATAIATPLAKLIGDRQLYSKIQGRDYVKCEGWTTMGAMLGIVPMEVSSVCDASGVYVSTVELVNMKTGKVVGRASAECGNPDEVDKNGKPLWASRAAYARRSMAATRATGKAFRLSFSWIMCMAGYMPTPAEEMDFAAQGESENPAPRGDTPRKEWPAKGVPPPSVPVVDGAPVWRGKLVGMDTKTGKSRGKPWTLFTFTGQDNRKFGTFSETIASGLMKLEGHFVEIVFSTTAKGNDNIEEYRDVTVDEVPL